MLIWLTSIAVIVLDAVTKNLAVRQIIGSEITLNHGLAFSLVTEKTGAILTTAAITAVLIWYYFKNRNSWNQKQQIAFGLIIGGGTGNLLERLYRGSVTDFIHVYSGVLNLADLAIIVGISLIIFDLIFYAHQN